MTTTEFQHQLQTELRKNLWIMMNDLRGQTETYEFKNLILGLIVYRYLSEKTEARVDKLLEKDKISYKKAWQNKELRNALRDELIQQIGYVISPDYLFSNMIKEIREINQGALEIKMLQNALNSVTESILGAAYQQEFQNLFDEMDLSFSKLGRDSKSRSKLIAMIMTSINELPLHYNNAFGDAYEYLVEMFAAIDGKKGGEFYTPRQVSKILAKIVTLGKRELKSVYDPTCGSASLILQVGKEAKVGKYYGQEKVPATYNLARMNLLLHGVSHQSIDIQNADTLEEPKHLDLRFEAVVGNPPYSVKWSAANRFLTDERFSEYGKLAPISKADYAFIQHMIYQLEDNGTMAVVLPHGVLFRGVAEGAIRRYLIEKKNYLDAVIGLPPNLFFGTAIPTCILVFKKRRKDNDHILFIDAANYFEKGKNQNRLRDEDVEKIISTYKNRQTIEKYSYAASLEEVKENDYNLNIPRYVDTFEEEELIDLEAIKKRLKEIDKEIANINETLTKYFVEFRL